MSLVAQLAKGRQTGVGDEWHVTECSASNGFFVKSMLFSSTSSPIPATTLWHHLYQTLKTGMRGFAAAACVPGRSE